MKKVLTALLALLTVASVFAGCSGGDTGAADTTEATETTAVVTEEEGPKLELERVDWEGRQFRVIGTEDPVNSQFTNFEIDAEEKTGELTIDAVYDRNAHIMETYNVDVTAILDANPTSLIQKFVNAGEDGFETSFNRQTQIPTLSSGGYFIDMYELPHITWENPWWYQSVNDAVSIEGKLYFSTGSFNLMDKNRMYILIFNKDMVTDYGFGNMYEIVDSGAFTVEKATQMGKTVASDLDGDGEMTDQDRYSWVQDSYNAFTAAVQSMDNHVVTKDENDTPIITINNERVIASIDKALKLTGDPETSLSCETFNGKVDYSYWGVSGRVFKAGNAMFCTSFINFPKGIKTYSADCEFDYGIIPFPKFDESQDSYISTPDKVGGTLLAVPKTSGDLDFVGYMLELLSYTTHEMVLPAFYETSAKGKYTYDEESGHMLDLIFEAPRYDLGVIFDWGGVGNMLYKIGQGGTNDFASKYAALADSAQLKLEETLELFAEQE